MKRRLFRVAVLCMLFSFGNIACDNSNKQESIEPEAITFEKEGELYLLKPSGDTIKKLDIELAESNYEHQTGLMYREGMEDSQAMLFIYENEANRSFYMKNTYFPLDIIYFAADSSLVSIQENAEPRDETSLPSEAPAKFILEVNGGLSDKWNLEPGDKINFERTND